MATNPTRVSVLDVVPVWRGGTATEALRRTVDTAVEVERLGFHRYWVAEHHNTRSLATSAPAVLAAHLAAATSTLRVGSGGVLLPNHPPLVVAEQFGILAALHPGRIDLGIGRAPGTDAVTARALRRTDTPQADDLAGQLDELAGYFSGTSGPISAGAAGEHRVPIWLLGSSPSSALLAARLGLPYAFAHQIKPQASVDALRAYRENFQPSAELAEPYSLVCAVIIAGESDGVAERVARPYLLAKIQMRAAGFDAFPTQDDADSYPYSADNRTFLREFADRQIIGGPDTVRQKATALLADSAADELMALTIVPDHNDRVASYRMLAEAVDVAEAVAAD